MFVPHRKHMPPLLVRVNFAFLYVDDDRTSQEHICGPPRPFTVIALLSICIPCLYLTGIAPAGLHALLRGWIYFPCVYHVRTSQETQLRACTACYGHSFTVLCFVAVCPHSRRERVYGLHGSSLTSLCAGSHPTAPRAHLCAQADRRTGGSIS
jgi:hypothetical protein